MGSIPEQDQSLLQLATFIEYATSYSIHISQCEGAHPPHGLRSLHLTTARVHLEEGHGFLRLPFLRQEST